MQPISSLSRFKVLEAANPWWQPPHGASRVRLPPRPRPLLHLVMERLTGGMSVWLFGPRGVGKTVLVHHLAVDLVDKGMPVGNLCYVPGDHPALTGETPEAVLALWAMLDPALSDDRLPRILIVDEPAVRHAAFAELAAAPPPGVVCLLVTSSMPAMPEPVEGESARLRPVYLPPMTFPEFAAVGPEPFGPEHPGGEIRVTPQLIERLNAQFDAYVRHGGFPALGRGPAFAAGLDAILPTAAVCTRFGIAGTHELSDLLLVLAREDGRRVSPESLAQSTGLAKNTIRKYVQFLEDVLLLRVVHRINKWGGRLRRARTFRVFLAHPGLRTLLLGHADAADASAQAGAAALMAQLPPSGRLVEHAWDEHGLGLAHLNPGRKLKTGEKLAWAMEVAGRDAGLDPSGLVTFCRVHRLTRALMTTRGYFKHTLLNGVSVHQLPLALQCYVMGYRLMWRQGLKLNAE